MSDAPTPDAPAPVVFEVDVHLDQAMSLLVSAVSPEDAKRAARDYVEGRTPDQPVLENRTVGRLTVDEPRLRP